MVGGRYRNGDLSFTKVTGGRNGYGAKLCNIFSTEFVVETGDKGTGMKYKQACGRHSGSVLISCPYWF
jgi:DNA topoisomerase-2